MTASVIVTIIVLAVLAVLMINGFMKGLLRLLLTTFSLVITFVIAAALVNPCTNFIKNDTDLGDKIEAKVDEYIGSKIDSEIIPKEEEIINSLPLPASIKKDLLENNTAQHYQEEGIVDFREYATKNVTDIIIKAIAYIILLVVIFIILRVLLHFTKFVNKIPVVGGVNRILGAVLGLLEGLIFVWTFCLIIMAFSGSEFGANCMRVINDSWVLKMIYDHNLLEATAKAIFKVF